MFSISIRDDRNEDISQRNVSLRSTLGREDTEVSPSPFVLQPNIEESQLRKKNSSSHQRRQKLLLLFIVIHVR